MSSCRERLLGLLMLALPLAVAAQAPKYTGIGRDATPREVAAWDIDVRPDFKGLPKGAGTVAQGQVIWEAQCASCHGVFGESNEVFQPIVGGTTKDDVKTGRVARLKDNSYPGRTTLMKLSSLSTLWDYIHRAMPWTNPKTLKPAEVYAVTAYILHLGGVLPADHTLSDANIADAQKLLPNRNGMTMDHALWPGPRRAVRPDVAATACMSDCATEPKVASLLPDHARNAHGNLAEQNRAVGAQRGAETAAAAPAAARPPQESAAALLAGKHGCVACHGLDNKILGPSFRDIAKAYGARTDAQAYLSGKIMTGSSGVWGSIPMPPQTLGEADAKAIAQWLAAGAKK
jgi:cytochrome c551/c552/cytochrome c553